MPGGPSVCISPMPAGYPILWKSWISGWWAGKNSPYIWMECPGGRSSWEFFDDLLERAQVLGTPGSGFGRNGEGFFRLTAFGTPEDTAEAMERFRAVYGR